jgi:hypothetical protein
VPNSFVGDWGERIVEALAGQLLGEPVRRVGVGRGGRERVDLESASYAIEVKTLIEGVEEKIKPSARDRREKTAYARGVRKQPVSLLLVLSPARWEVRVFRRMAFGAFRSAGMELLGSFPVREVLRPRGGRS